MQYRRRADKKASAATHGSKGSVVSTFKIWALCAALSFATAAMAQPTPKASAPQTPQHSDDEGAGAAISSIVVAEIDTCLKA